MESNDELMKLTYSSSIDKLKESNSSFDTGVLRVAYVGKNRNGSSISKEVFERSMGTIYNCPIVCNYNRDDDEIGSHDMEVVMKNDVPTLENLTQPVGVIPESANYWWETIEDDSGSHEYLCIDALIWKRQEAYSKIKDNDITDESMEIRVQDGHMEDGIYVIDAFEFLAFCLLETAEPCYESASLAVFSAGNFTEKYAEMMEDFKAAFKEVTVSNETDINLKFDSEGGKETLEQKKALAAEYGFELETLDFSVEEMDIDELREKFKAMKAEVPVPAAEPHEDFALESELRDELHAALSVEQIETPWGPDQHYYLWDYDPDVSEVYARDTVDWNLYGFPYSMDGDHVVIDFAAKKRMKLAVVPFDEGSKADPAPAMFAKIVDKYAENDSSWAEKYQEILAKVELLEPEVNELRQYKQDKLDSERAAGAEAIFNAFTDLNGVEAFEALKNDCSQFSIEELEDKCFAIRGRNAVQKFSTNTQKPPRLPVEKNKNESEPYGGLFAKFPPNR